MTARATRYWMTALGALGVFMATRSATAWQVSNEFEMDAPLPTVKDAEVEMGLLPTGYNGISSSAAWVGDSWFVAWTQSWNAPKLAVSRISASWQVLDSYRPMPAPNPGLTPGATWIASAGQSALVVWNEVDPSRSVTVPPLPTMIRAARLDRNGGLLDPAGIAIATIPTGTLGGVSAVVWNGVDFVVLSWEIGPSHPSAITASVTRIGLDGSVRDNPPIAIAPSATDLTVVSLACTTSNCLVLLHDGAGLQGVRIDTTGQILDPTPFPIAPYSKSEALASDGNEYLVAYLTADAGSVRALRIAADGTALDAPGALLGSNGIGSVNAYYDGTDFLAFFGEGGPSPKNYVTRIAPSGTVIDSPAKVANCGRGGGDCHAGTCLMPLGASGASLQNGVCSSFFPIVLSANAELGPDVASDGNGFAAVWQDGRDPELNAWGATTSTPDKLAAMRLDGTGKPLASTAATRKTPSLRLTSQSVAWDGTAYRVAWWDSTSTAVYLGGIDANGAISAGVALPSQHPPTISPPLITCSTGDCLVLWMELDLEVLPVHSGALGTLVTLPSARYFQTAAPIGDGFLIARTDSNSSSVLGTFVDANAAVLGEREVANSAGIKGSQGAVTTPYVSAIASHGSSAMLVIAMPTPFDCSWQLPCCAQKYDLTARAVRIDGTQLVLGDVVPIQTNVGSGAATASYDNGAYLLVWPKYPETCTPSSSGADLFAARVDAAGKILEGPQPISALDGDENAPALARTDAGRMLLTYQRFDAKNGYDTNRVRARTIEPGALSTTVFAGPDAGAPVDAATAANGSDAALAEPSRNVVGCACRAAASRSTTWVSAAMWMLAACGAGARRSKRRTRHPCASSPPVRAL